MRTLLSLFLLLFIFISCENKSSQTTLFSLRDTSTGIDFENTLTYTEELNPYTYRNFYNGGGVALGDINNDGLLDIYFTGNLVDNKLYLNKGNWQFEDITHKANVACKNVWSTGATFVDINHDGLLDIYVCKSGKPGGKNRHNELFINNGDTTFSEQSKAYNLDIIGLSVQAAFFDYDKDGDLDCYLLNNSIRSIGAYDLIKDQRNTASPDGNKLLKNEDGKFIDISTEAGIYSSAIGFGLGITLSDFNNDSWTDIYISNDFFERDYLYLNNKKGGFTESLENKFGSISMGSMGADASDLDNDLLSDLMVTEMLPSTLERQRTKALFESWDKYSLAIKQGYFNQFPRNVLQRNLGTNGFLEIGRFAGISATEWSWASLIFDMDNDGLKDILISNGIYKDLLDRDYLNYMANEERVRNMIKEDDEVIMKLIDLMPSQAVPNAIYKNMGGFTFEDKAMDWGLDQPSFSNGSAYGDLDNDGDLDIVINNVNMPTFIYENNSNRNTHRSIDFAFSSNGKNTEAIGTKAIINYGDGKKAMAENYTSRGFQSSISSGVHFGIGNHTQIDSLTILWPNGSKTIKTALASNKKYNYTQPEQYIIKKERALKKKKGPLKTSTPLFQFKHQENEFVDFNRERLLPQMFSNEGPALSSGDVNNDGIEDYYIGGAKNQSGSLFLSNTKGAFNEIRTPFILDAKSEDTASVFFDSDGDGDLDLYVCSGGKAFSKFDFALQDRLYINQGKGAFLKSKKPLPFSKMISTAIVTAKDYDKDGDLDLFVGGRYNPQLYGTPSSGYVLENMSNNTFKLSNEKALRNIGMITDAEWTDINGDGWPDLVISGEWMPITIFINEQGSLINKTTSFGLDNSSGIWSVLYSTDIDNDGDIDIIAGNIGENSFYKNGDRIYINDFDLNGYAEQIICHKINGMYFPIVDRDELVSQMPILKKKLLYYKDYATASMASIFDEQMIRSATVADINKVETTLFINEGETFSSIELPPEVQYSNIAAIQVMDINKDGIKDICFGGNQYRIKPQFGILDASHGWIVLGNLKNGKYSFKEIRSMGIKGQIRGFELIKKENKTILMTAINNNFLQFHEIQ
ncbi:MAG: VCBS repeat-containing protein [Cellulophaga sp.]